MSKKTFFTYANETIKESEGLGIKIYLRKEMAVSKCLAPWKGISVDVEGNLDVRIYKAE